MCMPDICSQGTNYTFFATTTIQGFYHHMSTKGKVSYFRGQLQIRVHTTCGNQGKL